MKIAYACIIALCTTACSADQSHVTTAYQLYKTCIDGNLQVAGAFPTTQEELPQYITELDKTCIVWTSAWLPVAIPIEEFNEEKASRFNILRRSMLNDLYAAFLDHLNKKKE
jgi:hypothetical protein